MHNINVFSFFTDPILRAPTIGCMLMCLGASLVGVLVFLKKQSLIGEVLSHAAYPGVILGTLLAGFFSIKASEEMQLALFALIGALLTSFLGLWLIHLLQRRLKVTSDAALCFVLSTFFGIGLTIASEVQFTFTTLYKQVLTYLYGQAATMTDIHIFIYGALALLLSLLILFFYKELQLTIFDAQYAKSLGLKVDVFNGLVFVLVTLAVIIGIRCVGVVLMSAMLIAPAVAARQFTERLLVMFFLAGCFGMFSGFLGVYSSVVLTEYFYLYFPQSQFNLPTGPMIVLVASFLCLLSLLFAPKRGVLIRLIRMISFRYDCIGENVLKTLWRNGSTLPQSLSDLARYQASSKLYLKIVLWRLVRQKAVQKNPNGSYFLTKSGFSQAERIVRLHRLWEVYLVEYLDVGVERVHKSAEEMEHILTFELERELTLLLNDPQKDPHHQPIPPMRSLYVPSSDAN